MAEFMALKQAVATYLENGMLVSFEGFTHLMPFARARSIARTGVI